MSLSSNKKKEWRPIEAAIRSSRESLEHTVNITLKEDNPLSSVHFLSDLYLKKGLSAAQIAKEIVSSKSAVLSALKKFQIPIREPHLPHGRQSQTKYGDKRFKGLVTSFKKEEETAKAIKDMADKGLSLREICKILTTMKIPTKNKHRKWHPEMLRRILQGNN